MNSDFKQVPDATFAPTEKQRMYLTKNGIPISPTLNRFEAHRLIGEHVAKERGSRPTQRQEALLRKRGHWPPSLTRGDAWDLINQIARQEGWKADRSAW